MLIRSYWHQMSGCRCVLTSWGLYDGHKDRNANCITHIYAALSDDVPHTYLGGLSRCWVALYHDHILSWVKTSSVKVLALKCLKAALTLTQNRTVHVVFLYQRRDEWLQANLHRGWKLLGLRLSSASLCGTPSQVNNVTDDNTTGFNNVA